MVVIDEAHYIKNPDAIRTRNSRRLLDSCDRAILLTGTPLENRLLDLWSIVDFIQPGYLGDQEHFTETYEPRVRAADPSAVPDATAEPVYAELSEAWPGPGRAAKTEQPEK